MSIVVNSRRTETEYPYEMSALRNLKSSYILVNQFRTFSRCTFQNKNGNYVYTIPARYCSVPPTQNLPKKSKGLGKKGPMSWKTFAVTAGISGSLLAFMLYIRREKEIGEHILGNKKKII